MEKPRVSVVIPSWNTRELLGRCLESVERQDIPGGMEIVVVEDASTDGTADLLRKFGDRVRVVWNETSVGYAAAANQGAAAARGQVLLVLNADTELLSPDSLARLSASAEMPGIGIAGPRLINPDRSLQPSCAADPSLTRSLIVGSGLHRIVPRRFLRRVAPEFWPHDRPTDTDWLMGAAIAIRADLFRELGGFWSQTYAEDQDLAYRVRQRGFRVRFDNSTDVLHVGNASQGQLRSDVQRAARVARAELEFLHTHYPRTRAAAIRVVVGLSYGLRAAVHTLLRRPRRTGIYKVMARTYATYRPPQPIARAR